MLSIATSISSRALSRLPLYSTWIVSVVVCIDPLLCLVSSLIRCVIGESCRHRTCKGGDDCIEYLTVASNVDEGRRVIIVF